jgi:hypothetical protein
MEQAFALITHREMATEAFVMTARWDLKDGIDNF